MEEEGYPYSFINKIVRRDENCSLSALGIWVVGVSFTCGKVLTKNFLLSQGPKTEKNRKCIEKGLKELVEKKLVIKFPVNPDDTLDNSDEVYLFSQYPFTDEQIQAFHNHPQK